LGSSHARPGVDKCFKGGARRRDRKGQRNAYDDEKKVGLEREANTNKHSLEKLRRFFSAIGAVDDQIAALRVGTGCGAIGQDVHTEGYTRAQISRSLQKHLSVT
jgi:hypothetical protein